MPEARIYAVAGNPALHSRSPAIFRRAFESEAVAATYTRLAADSAAEALGVARSIGLSGLNVTSPFKEDMVPLMDELGDEARTIGAVNTILLDKGRARGLNVDGDGVIAMCEKAGFEPRGARVAVLGAGGAAKAAALALRKKDADVVLINRSGERGRMAAEAVGCRFVPLGDARDEIGNSDAVFACWPKSARQFDASMLSGDQIVLDANYGDSIFEKAARKAGCGYVDGREWLLGQALSVFKLFTGRNAPKEAMRKALDPGRAEGHIILAGMMGTGKSLVAVELAARLRLEAVDTDATVVRMSGKRISEIFAEYGEAEFRRLEAVAVEEALGNARSVIAMGGGALMNGELAKLARERGTVIWLWATPETCAGRASDGLRPLIEGRDPAMAMKEILSRRLSSYASSSDLIVSTEDRDVEGVAGKIFDEIGESRKG
jgi:shikimate dehydrogenase